MSDDSVAGDPRTSERDAVGIEVALAGTVRANPVVLLVDDDDLVRSAHKKLMERSGFDVTSVASASAALELLNSSGSGLDVVVTDVEMPDMNGVALLREIRKHHRDLPVLLVTGYPRVDSAMAAVNGGGFRYLTKPVNPGELIASVHEAVGLRRLAQLKQLALEMLQDDPQWLGNRASLDRQFEQSRTELWMAFQPIVSWRDRELFGYEALVRSNSEVMNTPALLFSAAERLGRVTALGRAIRRLVADAFVSVPSGAVVFVNLHALDLLDDELYDDRSPLTKFASRIVLEVTERSSLENVGGLTDRIVALRKLGYRIAVDDLGAGYAGLSSFNLLEPDVAKLDMSLIRGIDTSQRKQSLIRSMITVCTGELGVDVVCEGVETEQERDMLMRLGATFLQGYLLGRPTRGFERIVFDSQVWPISNGMLHRKAKVVSG